MARLVLLSIFTLLFYTSCDKNLSSYYSKLFLTNTLAANSWKRPVRNEDFKNIKQKNCLKYDIVDFIIIGAGAAGAVLANRLSANGTFKVLLIEAGDDENDFSLIPGAYLSNINSSRNWGYSTTPQEFACHKSPNNRCSFNSGKALGGSSAINGMGYVRGNQYDFDNWASLGNEGWSYDEILPYYIKSEKFTGSNGDQGYHGTNGPLHIYKNKYDNEISKVIESAAKELGNMWTDYNGKNQIGFNKMYSNIKNGLRHSTNQAYIQPIKDRKNLIILTKSLATKIYYKKNKANKVMFILNNRCWLAFARNEIIVSAGVINTPQLLQLSGIGPKKDLPGMNIKVNLPVGKNFHDHVCLLSGGMKINTNITAKIKTLEEEIQDFLNRDGRLNKGVGNYLIFHQIAKNKLNYFKIKPDYEITYNVGYKNWFKINDKITDIQINLNPILQYPKSVGYVRINSLDPLEYPIINPNILSEKEDLEVLMDAIKYNLKFINTNSMKKINSQLIIQPECNKFTSDEYWSCIIKHYGYNCLHGSGTCRMGLDKSESVVGNNLKVHGFHNLRIVDASVFPTAVSGHYLSTVVMLAEKAADMILEENLK